MPGWSKTALIGIGGKRFTEEERRAYHEGVQRALDEIETIPDETDTDETWDEVFRGLAAARLGPPDARRTP